MEDGALKVLEQHRQSLPKQSEVCTGPSSGQSPNDPAVSTGVEYYKQSLLLKQSSGPFVATTVAEAEGNLAVFPVPDAFPIPEEMKRAVDAACAGILKDIKY